METSLAEALRTIVTDLDVRLDPFEAMAYYINRKYVPIVSLSGNTAHSEGTYEGPGTLQ